MKIEIVGAGTNLGTVAAVPPVTNGIFGNSNGVPRRYVLLFSIYDMW